MMSAFQEKTRGFLIFQRNLLAALVLILAVTTTILSGFLFMKKERVIISPPVVEREFWLEASAVSPTYLEQMGSFLGQLLLSKSTASASSQRAVLLRHTDPAFTATLRNKLLSEEEELKKQNASYVFYPHTIQASPDKLQVVLEGDREYYVSGQQISSETRSYLLTFRYTGSRILLTSIQAQEKSS